jgi:hypothetical protein
MHHVLEHADEQISFSLGRKPQIYAGQVKMSYKVKKVTFAVGLVIQVTIAAGQKNFSDNLK